MLRVLFDGHLQGSQFIIGALNLYASKIQLLEFDEALQYIDKCREQVEKERELAQPLGDEVKLNRIYVVGAFLSMLRDYALFWGKVFSNDFVGSWDALQDVQDGLRVVKRFCETWRVPYLNTIEQQAIALEKLYPHKIFASAELVLSDVKCSICGKDADSLDCPHISGELYGGKMACGIVGKIEAVSGVALLKRPSDKRCVIQRENTEDKFAAVAKLARFMNSQKIGPWQVADIQESKRRKEIDEFNELQEDNRCPCGSGKTFRECCMQVGYVEVPHIEIRLNEPPMPIFQLHRSG